MGKNQKEKKSIKAKIKTELGYMKKGAKILPKAIAKKGKQWFEQQVEAARERAKLEKEIEEEAKKAEKEAFKEEAIRRARERGVAKARKGRAGWRGTLQEVGVIGERISLSNVLGLETEKKPTKVVTKNELEGLGNIEAGSFLMSGLGEKKKGKPFGDFEVESVTLKRKKRKKGKK